MEQNREQLLSDFELAAPYMLHNETEEGIRLQQVFMFLTNQLYKEVSTVQD